MRMPSMHAHEVRASTNELVDDLVELIRRTSTDLPEDVVAALEKGREAEAAGSPAQSIFDTILENIPKARAESIPLCQDTGTLIFYIDHPAGWSTRSIAAQVREAVVAATQKGYLRPNAVDSLTGENTGDNLGDGQPSLHFEEWDRPELRFRLMLKGGGCENVGAQYALPDGSIGADRNLEGVRRACLDAVHRAQGKGCAPGVLGVCVGGDRGSGYVESKRQLFRRLDDENENPELAELERRITREANEMGIGPMGFGGATTLLGVKIGALHRLPASFFVSISYMCWEYRRRSMVWRGKGEFEID